MDTDSDPALIFFDIQAAFPNVSWNWINFVLTHMDVPSWLMNAVFGTCFGTESEFNYSAASLVANVFAS